MPSVGATLLVTSGGSLVGRAILDVLEPRRADLRVIAINSDLDAPHVQRFDRVDRVSPLSSPDFTRELVDVVERERPDLILAGRDDDVVLLAGLAGDGRIDHRLLASGPLPLARVLRDTAGTAAWAASRSLPFVPTVSLGQAQSRESLMSLASSGGPPWIVKPACGQGSRDVSVVTDLEGLLAAANQQGFVAQPLLRPVDVGQRMGPWSYEDQGWEADCQVVLGPDSAVWALHTFVTHMQRGFPMITQPSSDSGLGELGQMWAAALSAARWRGPVNIQARRSAAGEWLPFEINPRLGGGAPLRVRAGFDEVGMLIHAFLGIELPGYPAR